MKSDAYVTTIKMTTADREKIAEWEKQNMTSMNAEVLRAIRERAAREAQTAKVA